MKKVCLNGGVVVGFASVTRHGQQSPACGDDVVALGRVELAARGRELHDELRFCQRLSVADTYLFAEWGSFVDGWRFVSRKFSAPTWEAAEKAAEEWADGELTKLETALAVRAAALQAAESLPAAPVPTTRPCRVGDVLLSQRNAETGTSWDITVHEPVAHPKSGATIRSDFVQLMLTYRIPRPIPESLLPSLSGQLVLDEQLSGGWGFERVGVDYRHRTHVVSCDSIAEGLQRLTASAVQADTMIMTIYEAHMASQRRRQELLDAAYAAYPVPVTDAE